MTKEKVMVAMSGGVDSSVTAALLHKEGYELIGGTMEVIEGEKSSVSKGAVKDSRKIANYLGITHYSFDLKEEFKKAVINNFFQEYAKGRTPNPCLICNEKIKFGILLEKAMELGADYIATGHYARIIHNSKGRHILKKAEDKIKDQTYMLYNLNQYQLEHTLMPLGRYTKREVRETAKKLGFSIHNKEESQDICFIADNDYTKYLNNKNPELFRSGYIYDLEGNKLGRHNGLHNYTIGQRKGLGIAAGYPLYVIKLDRENNAVIVGVDEQVYSKGLVADSLNWVRISSLEDDLNVKAKIRYNSKEEDAVIYPTDNKNEVNVVFKEKQRAVTPGQSVVFYDGDTVVGGGIIKQAF
ncbi:MAG: tRNA 2-thiouridine(34) synthase MnmA [Halothermotrichaceae bacterium]